MSNDEDYTDIDDDFESEEEQEDSPKLPGKQVGKNKFRESEKRVQHNEREKKSREVLKACFEELHSVLPNQGEKKVIRRNVLLNCISYLQNMNTKFATEADLEDLRRQNRNLERQIEILGKRRPKQQASGTSTSKTSGSDWETSSKTSRTTRTSESDWETTSDTSENEVEPSNGTSRMAKTSDNKFDSTSGTSRMSLPSGSEFNSRSGTSKMSDTSENKFENLPKNRRIIHAKRRL